MVKEVAQADVGANVGDAGLVVVAGSVADSVRGFVFAPIEYEQDRETRPELQAQKWKKGGQKR